MIIAIDIMKNISDKIKCLTYIFKVLERKNNHQLFLIISEIIHSTKENNL